MITFCYMTMGSENPIWYSDFLNSIKNIPYPIIHIKGYKNNIQKGRIELIKKVQTPFFIFIDPDDILIIKGVLKCLDFLKENEKYAACFSREVYINAFGIVTNTQNTSPFRHESLRMSPLIMHNSTVYRTDIVKSLLKHFDNVTFNKFEWVLKLILSYHYPVYKINVPGYKFRIHSQGHHLRKTTPKNQIGYFETIPYLLQNGLIE